MVLFFHAQNLAKRLREVIIGHSQGTRNLGHAFYPSLEHTWSNLLAMQVLESKRVTSVHLSFASYVQNCQ